MPLGLIGTLPGVASERRAGCSRFVLHFVSIHPGRTQTLARYDLWSKILQFSTEIEGATNFTINSTVLAGRSKAERLDDERLLQALGIEANSHQRTLRPIHGIEAALAAVGPRVLSIDIYSDEAWVAGISDWGDEMDVIFSDRAWEALSIEIAQTCPGLVIDHAEALSRPTFTGR